ncbi:65-kDa microtubule-associated protein 3 isoform X2 [Andrographis paniculata]|uniref:65-kDa microtubule-associated protein 3 isoform X2 n=1 Tax=Andrographis paniculata TaxID=175694 RepID=UPI0021E79E89|nr:65-kDa microtubule-associated protein 3 isoform X2 [Andrographis paniculata]
MATTCGSLLTELQKIWDEIGESDDERDKMLFELEQECLDAYRRKVEQANRGRSQLRQAVAEAEGQLADICAALGDQPVHIKKSSGGLKNELHGIMPHLEAMKKKRNERKSQFVEVVKQISSISDELGGTEKRNLDTIVIDENDLSLKRLDDLRNKLVLLQKEKVERLNQILEKLNNLKGLCSVLGMDFNSILHGVNPSLDDTHEIRCISGDTIEGLSSTILRLKNAKLERMQRLQDLAMTMVELWNLMDTPFEEQQMFQNVTRIIASSEDEITEPDSLSLDLINNAEAEVKRLQQVKMRKIKEVILKKRVILEEICRDAHMVVEELGEHLSVESMESGAISPSDLLEQLELQISKVKMEALSRKEILEKVQKWLAACEEECWLEEYNRDDNRYNAGRGTHLMLKRAEKARIVVNKIPAMVDALKSKLKAWENERNVDFLYDGVGAMSMLDQYCEIKHLKEQERQRQRDQKKLHGMLMTEQESLYGSKPSPSKSGNKNFRQSNIGAANKKFSLGGSLLQSTIGDKPAAPSRSLLKNNPVKRQGKINTPGGAIKNPPSNASKARQAEAAPQRKPLSPISSLSSNIIPPCSFSDLKSQSGDCHDVHALCRTPVVTPTKNMYSTHDENGTPKVMVSVAATPPTVSVAMQTAATPFTPGMRGGRGKNQEIEYSYEERRAGFVVAPSKSFHLV